VPVRVGESVSAGEMLATLDRAGLSAALAAARGDATAAAGSYGGGRVPQAAWSSARAKLATAQAHLRELSAGGPAALSDRIAAASAQRQAILKVEADRRALDRQRALYAGGVAAAKDAQAARVQLDADLADARAASAKVAAASAGYAAALRQAQADVAQAQSDVSAAGAQRQVLAGQAQSASARLTAAQRDFENGVLRAPSDGVVLAIAKHPGEYVDATMPVLDVGPPRGSEITLSVPAEDGRDVRVGEPVTIELAQTARRAAGRVTAIVPSVDATTQATTVIVRGVPRGAIAGDAVTARIVVGRERGILVPASAVVQDPQTGSTVVFVRDLNAKDGPPFRSRAIVVATSDAATTLVRSGLRAGEIVATEGAYDLLAPAGGS
jgi:RND family efflux transporter MFP subunit